MAAVRLRTRKLQRGGDCAACADILTTAVLVIELQRGGDCAAQHHGRHLQEGPRGAVGAGLPHGAGHDVAQRQEQKYAAGDAVAEGLKLPRGVKTKGKIRITWCNIFS